MEKCSSDKLWEYRIDTYFYGDGTIESAMVRPAHHETKLLQKVATNVWYNNSGNIVCKTNVLYCILGYILWSTRMCIL